MFPVVRMAAPNRRDIDEIMAEVAPVVTKARYDKQWDDFIAWLDKEEGHKPVEDDFIRFFSYLKQTRKLKVSTIWVIYSRLNNTYKRK